MEAVLIHPILTVDLVVLEAVLAQITAAEDLEHLVKDTQEALRLDRIGAVEPEEEPEELVQTV